jgi:hypothetical protein
MKKLIVAILIVLLSAGISLAAGGKNRGDEGQGEVIQDFCGPNDDCAGYPYWWD